MTDEQVEAIAARAGRSAAKEVMEQHWQIIGYDITDPKDMQRAQSDFVYLRSSHRRFHNASTWAGRSVVVALMSVVIAIFALGWKVFTGQNLGGGGPYN